MNKNYPGMNIRIKELRNKKNWRQEDLANNANISLSTIKNIENPEKNPSESTIRKVANSLNTTVDYLKFGKDKEFSDEILEVFSQIPKEKGKLYLEFITKLENLKEN